MNHHEHYGFDVTAPPRPRRGDYDQLGVYIRPATRRELARDTLGLLTTLLLSLAGGAVGAVVLLVVFGLIKGVL